MRFIYEYCTKCLEIEHFSPKLVRDNENRSLNHLFIKFPFSNCKNFCKWWLPLADPRSPIQRISFQYSFSLHWQCVYCDLSVRRLKAMVFLYSLPVPRCLCYHLSRVRSSYHRSHSVPGALSVAPPLPLHLSWQWLRWEPVGDLRGTKLDLSVRKFEKVNIDPASLGLNKGTSG